MEGAEHLAAETLTAEQTVAYSVGQAVIGEPKSQSKMEYDIGMYQKDDKKQYNFFGCMVKARRENIFSGEVHTGKNMLNGVVS